MQSLNHYVYNHRETIFKKTTATGHFTGAILISVIFCILIFIIMQKPGNFRCIVGVHVHTNLSSKRHIVVQCGLPVIFGRKNLYWSCFEVRNLPIGEAWTISVQIKICFARFREVKSSSQEIFPLSNHLVKWISEIKRITKLPICI